MTIPANIKSVPRNRLKQWLFEPFMFIAGSQALLTGLGIILLSAFVGWLSNTHFDGVIDVHKGLESPLWYFFAEGLVNWICLTIPLFFFGLIISRSSFRMIDVLGTQALARWPYLIAALVMLPKANQKVGEYLTSKFSQIPTPAINHLDLTIFILSIIIAILMAVWMVTLMYKAYTVSCNIKGPKAAITFIISLIGSEVLSKFVILRLYV